MVSKAGGALSVPMNGNCDFLQAPTWVVGFRCEGANSTGQGRVTLLTEIRCGATGSGCGTLGSASPGWAWLGTQAYTQFWKLVTWCQLSFLVSTGPLKPAQ